MDATEAAALREPFPASAIGKLPKPKSKDAQKGNCPECGGWHGLPAVHLDYVGHAATTARLLAVDPHWTWEPYATTPEGLPLLTNGGLWIKLTVCGVTRPGFGDGASIKEQIGDAIRNAAMRFGVALDLWAKEDLHEIEHPPEPPAYIADADAARIRELLNAADGATRSAWLGRFGCKPAELPLARLAEADDWLSDLEPEPSPAPAIREEPK